MESVEQMKYKTSMKRVPDNVYSRLARLGNSFNVPNTEAFIIQEKLLFGDFKAKNLSPKNGKKRKYEVEFEL